MATKINFNQIKGASINALDVINVKNDGTAFNPAGLNAVIAAADSTMTIVFPYGTYTPTAEILRPYRAPTVAGPTFVFEGCTIQAGTNGQTLIHWCDSFGAMLGDVTFATGGKSSVSAFRMTPETEADTSQVLNQNRNRISASMRFSGLAEGIVLQTGALVTGTASGCWYNQFSGSMDFDSCDRCIWIKDGSIAADGRSGANANVFSGSIVMNGSINTGIQIDGGGGTVFFAPQFENITNGTSPNTTPTGLIIASAMTNGALNNDTTLYNPHWENCTLNASILNNSTRIYTNPSEVLNSSGTITAVWDRYATAISVKGMLLDTIFSSVTNISNIKGLWLMDAFTATSTILDRGTLGNAVTLRDAALASKNADTCVPRVDGLAFGLINDESHAWNTPSSTDFNFGNGTTDSAFSIVVLCTPILTANSEIVSRDSLVAAATVRAWSTEVTTGGVLSSYYFDESAGSYIGRTTAAGAVTANDLVLITFTYSGSAASSGAKIYVNETPVDNANNQNGAYTAMETSALDVGNYRLSAAGVAERMFRANVYAVMIVAEELGANQVRRLSYALRSYVQSDPQG